MLSLVYPSGPFKCLKSVLWETLPSAHVAPLALQPLPITALSVLSAKCLLGNTVLSILLDESNSIDIPCKRIHALIWQLIDCCTKIRYPLTFNVICWKLSTFKLTKSQWSASWECLHRYDSPLIGAALKWGIHWSSMCFKHLSSTLYHIYFSNALLQYNVTTNFNKSLTSWNLALLYPIID